MSKFLTTIILVAAFALNAYSQKLVLTGNVNSFLTRDSDGGRIYYAEQGERFDVNKFITYNNKKEFQFEMSISKIKKENVQVLVFSMDTTQNSNDEDACVQRINIGEIVNAPEFSKLKTIRLKTDLLLDINCESSIYYDAKEENKDRFVGQYHFESNDTLRTIEIGNVFFRYKSTLSKATQDYMTEEFGGWSYDAENKEFTIHVWRQMNRKFGLAISKPLTFKFEVQETDGGIKFKSKSGILTKL